MRARSGYTLLEALVVTAIIGVLLAIALPSFSASLAAARVNGAASRLAGSFAVARLEAIKFAEHTVVCASDDASGCGGDWKDGWLVFRDDDDDGVRDDGEPVIRRNEGIDDVEVSVRAAGTPAPDVADPPEGTALNAVAFDYRGFPDRAAMATFSRNAARASVALGLVGRSEIR